MKSNIKKHNSDSSKIILSIGMIVKNEEKHLENCLSALKKLMDQISCELIIVDTGSTDRTKEIALKYTDKVYDFEWINDFAAARNYGLERAVGEWFMFLDADEYIDEDVSEMVTFFNMPELYNKYNSASYIIRNYFHEHSKVCTDFLGSRLVRLLPGVKFSGAIHESLPQYFPHGVFSTVFHHYGYLNDDKKVVEDKRERNRTPMLEEYEKDPKNQRILSLMVDVYSDDEHTERFYNEWLEVARNEPNHPYRNACYAGLSGFYANRERYDEALDIANEFFNVDDAKESVTVVEVYYIMARVYMNQDKFEDAYKYFLKYFDSIEDYKSGKLGMMDLRCKPVNGLQEYECQEQVMKAARCLFNMDKYSEALEMLERVDIKEIIIPNLRLYLNVIRDLVGKTKDYGKLASYYEKILDLNDPDKESLILYLMEEYYIDHESERPEFIKSLAMSNVDGDFIKLMKILDNPYDVNMMEKLQELTDTVSIWSDGFSELTYLDMKYDVDFSVPIEKMGYEEIRQQFPLIAKAHKDFAEVALKCCKYEKFTDSIKKLFWMISALETASLSSKELPNDEKLELYNNFVASLADYVNNIYNPELLNPADIEVLPPLHRFGYYMGAGQTMLSCGDSVGYIRSLKEALKYCEPMKDIVALLLKEFEENF